MKNKRKSIAILCLLLALSLALTGCGRQYYGGITERTDGLASALLAGALFGALTESADRTGTGPTAEGELLHNAGGADQDDENEIGNQESQAAELGDHDGEAPDVAHADG